MFCSADVVQKSEHEPLLLAQYSASPAKIRQQNIYPKTGKHTATDAKINAAFEFRSKFGP